jgi:hypothetical protein
MECAGGHPHPHQARRIEWALPSHAAAARGHAAALHLWRPVEERGVRGKLSIPHTRRSPTVGAVARRPNGDLLGLLTTAQCGGGGTAISYSSSRPLTGPSVLDPTRGVSLGFPCSTPHAASHWAFRARSHTRRLTGPSVLDPTRGLSLGLPCSISHAASHWAVVARCPTAKSSGWLGVYPHLVVTQPTEGRYARTKRGRGEPADETTLPPRTTVAAAPRKPAHKQPRGITRISAARDITYARTSWH